MEDSMDSYFNSNKFVDSIYKIRRMHYRDLLWTFGDTEVIYNKNKKKGVPYGPGDIVYRYNNFGYRCPDFSLWKMPPSVVYLGCSHTEGTGIPYEEVWTYKLHKMVEKSLGTELGFCNLGIGGNSNDTITRVLFTAHMLNPVLVVILYSYNNRREYFSKVSNGIMNNYGTPRNSKERFIISSADDQDDLMNFIKNHQMVSMRLKQIGVPGMFTTIQAGVHGFCRMVNEDPNFIAHNQNGSRVDVARDLLHPGAKTNTLTAEAFYEHFRDNLRGVTASLLRSKLSGVVSVAGS